MKKMRKILSLLLTTALLIVPATAFADTSNLAFDADFSEFNSFEGETANISHKITDKSGNNLTVDYSKAGSAELKEEKSGENTLKYLSFTDGNFAAFRVQNQKILGLDNMTVEIWAKPNIIAEKVAGDKNRVLFSVAKSSKNNASFYAALSDTKLFLTVNGNTAECSIADYMNKWSQFTFTRSYDGNGNVTVSAYVNSQQLINETFSGVTKETETDKYFYIGAYGTLSATQKSTMYIGGISEARIYSSAFSQADVGRNYLKQAQTYATDSATDPADPNIPVVEEDSGVLFDLQTGDSISDLADSSENNIAVSKEGTLSLSTFKGVSGDVKYVKINGKTEDQSINFTDAKLLGNKKITVEFYMKAPDFTQRFDNAEIFKIARNDNHKSLVFTMGSDGSTSVKMKLDGDDINLVNTGSLKDKILEKGDWIHIALTRTFDEGTHKVLSDLYVNGEKVGSGEADYIYSLDENEAYKYYFGNKNYVGGFSEIRVYGKILQETEIKSLYEQNVEKYTAVNSGELFELDGKTDISRNDLSLSFRLNSSETVSDVKFIDLVSGKDISSDISYNDNGFDVTFNQYLKYGQQIKVYSPFLNDYVLKNVSKGNASATVTVYNSKNREIKALDGSDSYIVIPELTVNGSAAATYKYSVVARDENGIAVACEGGSFSGTSAYVSLSDTKTAVTISVYVWENNGGTLVPVYGTPVIIK